MVGSELLKLIFFFFFGEELLWFYGYIGGVVVMSGWDSMNNFSWFFLFLTFDVEGYVRNM